MSDNTKKTWTVEVDFDPEHKEYVLPLPTDLLNQVGWDIGDTLDWTDNFDGTWSIKKVDENKQEVYNKDNEDSN